MEHSLPFDPSYGYDEGDLRAIKGPTEPNDLSEFWESTYEQTLAMPLNLARREIPSPDPATSRFEVEFDGLAGGRVGAWLTVPRSGFSRGVVVGHGYGGRDGPDEQVPGPPAAVIFPCGRGFNRSRAADVPDSAPLHVVHGIESRETYIHRMCAADLWSAASVLLELFPQARQNLHYYGCSFGGGMGALALAWDNRFSRASLDVPSFGNHPLRVTLPCNGSGEAVRLLYQREPQILSVLNYFDGANTARHIRIPVLVACARFDPAVPPPGQFSIFNCLGGPRALFIRPAAHFEYAESAKVDKAFFARTNAWFT